MSDYSSCVVDSVCENEFWGIWEDNRGDLYRKCLSMMNWDRDDAEDALSVAMIRAFEKSRIQEEEIRNYRAWFFRITHNVCIDIIRKKKVHLKLSTDSEEFSREESQVQIEEPVDSAGSVCEYSEIFEYLSNTIMELPERLQQPLLLTTFTGMTSDEVSAKLKISNANLRKRVQLARNRIAGEMKGKTQCPDGMHIPMNTEGFRLFEPIRDKASFFLSFTPREVEPDYNRAVLVKAQGKYTQTLCFTSSPAYNLDEVNIIKDYINKYPGGWKKRLELAEYYYSVGSFDQALFELNGVNRRHSLSVKAYKRVGDIYRISGITNKSVEAYSEARKIVQRDSSKHFFQGLIECSCNRGDKAIECLEYAILKEPDNQVFYATAGEIAMGEGRHSYAGRMFRRALDIDGNDLKSTIYLYILSHINCSERKDIFNYASRIRELNRGISIRQLNSLCRNIFRGRGSEKIS